MLCVWHDNINFINVKFTKRNDVSTRDGKVPYGLLSRSCFYYPNFIAVAPLRLGIKRFPKVTWIWRNDASSFCGGVPTRILLMRFTLLSKFDVSSFPMTGDMSILLKLLILLALNSTKLIVISLLRATQNWPYSFVFTDFVQVTYVLLSLHKTLSHEKQFQPSPFDKKFKSHS